MDEILSQHLPASKPDKGHINKAIEITIRIGLLIFIFGWCFTILRPFLSIILWGIIIAIAAYPAFLRLQQLLGGRKKFAAVLITLLGLSIIIIPGVIIGESVSKGITHLREVNQDIAHLIPAPQSVLKTWPVYAQPVIDIWQQVSDNLADAMKKYGADLKPVLGILLSALASIGTGLLHFIFSVLLAGVLLIYAESGGVAARKVFTKIADDDGHHFANIAVITIRQVIKGIIGVAFIQAILAGIGFYAAGLSMAGFLTIITLILCIIQIGMLPIIIPVVIYMFSSASPSAAGLLTGWLILVMLSENILKPWLLGHGSAVPMPVIFLGAIGGFISMGFLGLFLGAVILSLGYKLYEIWIHTAAKQEETKPSTIDSD